MHGEDSKAGPQQEPDTLNHRVDRFPGEQPGTAHPSREEPGKDTWILAIGQPGSREEALPGEHSATETHGGRSDAGSELSRRVAEAPSLSHRPDQAFNEA